MAAPIDISNLDAQVNQSIEKIDKYVKDPIKTGSLDTELNDLLRKLNAASNEISDQKMISEHDLRIKKLQNKISEYENKRNTIQLQTRANLAAAETSPDNIRLIAFKKSIESEISSPISVSEMQKLLDKLDTLEPDGRKVVVSYLWSKLAHAGYSMTIQNNKISLFHSTETKNSELLEATLSAYIDAKKVNLSEIQRAILMGSWSFGEFLDTQVDLNSITTLKYVNFLEWVYKIDLSKAGSPAQKIGIINKTGATPAEKAFLISYVNGGYGSYNLVPDAERQKKLRIESKELFGSEEYKKFQWTVDTASAGAAQAERKKMQQGWKKEELTIDSFMDNPASAITKYPWTSLALVGASIWKFGFGKTIFWILAAVLGLKAVNELWDTEMGRELDKNIRKWAKETVGALWGAADKASQVAQDTIGNNVPIAGPGNTPSSYQADLRKKVEANPSLIQDIDKLTNAPSSKFSWKLDDYLKFIETDLREIPLSKLFPSDHKKTIFFDNFETEFSIGDKLSGKMLKRVLREYLTGNQVVTWNWDKLGEKEKNDFLTLHKITPADIQSKKLSHIIESVHKARAWSAVPWQVQQAPVSSLVPTRHRIGSVDIDVGKNVQTNSVAIAYGADGKEYTNSQSKLPKDTNGKFHIPKDGVVKLGANVIKITWIDHLEIEYSGEKVYVSVAQLKSI